MATYTVTTLTDELDVGATEALPGSSGLSLREAIALANASVGVADTIVFSSGLSGGTVRLTNAAGTLQVTDALTISGDIGNDGSPNITITGDVGDDDTTLAGTDITILDSTAATERDDNVRIIYSTADVTLDGLILTGGMTNAVVENGGAVIAGLNDVVLTNSIVSGNAVQATGSGGGGVFADNITVENSSISGNFASFIGGGLYARTDLTVVSTTVTGNSAGSIRGGVFSSGTVSFTDSLLLGNGASNYGPSDISLIGGNIIGTSVTSGATVTGSTTVDAVFANVSNRGGVLTVGANGVPQIALKLDATNPALDAADANAPPTDIVGHARFDQPGVTDKNGSFADIGAVEAGELVSLVVTTAIDVVDAFDGKTSLREAVAYANVHANPDANTPDVITFDSSVFTGGVASLIRLTQGEIQISDAVKIDGSTGTGIVITGDKNDNDVTVAGTDVTDVGASGSALLTDNSRIFNVTSATADTTLDSLTLTGGRTAVDGAAASGGAVVSVASLTLVDSTVSGNSTEGVSARGGGIAGTTVTLTNSTVSGNATAFEDADGGGIFGTTITLTNSTVSQNSTAADFAAGGGIFGTTVTLNNSTVSGNATVGNDAWGGGIAGTTVNLTNSTVYGNATADANSSGGGIFGTTVTLTNSTVSGNSTAAGDSFGGGISGSNVTLTNSLVLGNNSVLTTADELFSAAPITANGLNIVGADAAAFDATGIANVINADPTSVFAQTADIDPGAATVLAGVLGNNGGNVQTVALKLDTTNPALDSADNAAPPTDALGNARFDQLTVFDVNGSTADLGAAEAGEFPSLVVTTSVDLVDAFDGQTSLREAVAYANSLANVDANTPDVITFDSSVFTGGAASLIRLTQGEIAITDAVTIDGLTATAVTITGDKNGDDKLVAGTNITDVAASYAGSPGAASDFLDDNSRIFNISAGADTTLTGLVLTGGRATAAFAGGGAIASRADLALVDSTVSGNLTTGDLANGGGIDGTTVTLTNSTVSGNTAAGVSGNGGGISGITVTLTNSTVFENTAAGFGGGVVGGLNLNLTNSTLSHNTASVSGGGGAGHVVNVVNSTVTGNTAASEGGIEAARPTLTNSIVLGNSSDEINFDINVQQQVNYAGLNIVGTGGDTDGSDGRINADPTKVFAQTTDIDPGAGIVLAGVLADNGGPVRTVALKPDAANPALDAALGSPPATDARGEARQDLAGVGNNGVNFADLGAFEFIDQPPTITALPVLNSIAENTSTATAIKFASLSIVDPDGNNTLSLSGADAALFEIKSDGIYLRAGTVLDFETNPILDVTLDVATLGNGSKSKSATFAVTDVNEAPTAIAFTNVLSTISESASTAARIKVANILITDDALGTETITLAGADAAKFEVINGVLYIKAGATLDFETNPSLDVTVNVNDPTVGGAIDLARALRVTVTDVAETINGTAAADVLSGGAGADRIFGLGGNDTINGGAGNDSIVGGAGVDRLTGGAGADTFIFSSITQSGYKVSGTAGEGGPLIDTTGVSLRDVITDFTHGTDRIDVSLIDANENLAGNQAFAFRGTGSLAGAGSLVYRQFDNAGTASDRTIVYFDTTGDGRSDMMIELTGLKTLTAVDFIL